MACADRSDPAHMACTAARDATLEAGRLLITTDFVVDETLTLIRFRLGLAAASAWWQQIDGSARLRWERVESEQPGSFVFRETAGTGTVVVMLLAVRPVYAIADKGRLHADYMQHRAKYEVGQRPELAQNAPAVREVGDPGQYKRQAAGHSRDRVGVLAQIDGPKHALGVAAGVEQAPHRGLERIEDMAGAADFALRQAGECRIDQSRIVTPGRRECRQRLTGASVRRAGRPCPPG